MIGSHILFENYIGFTYIFLEICIICCIITKGCCVFVINIY